MTHSWYSSAKCVCFLAWTWVQHSLNILLIPVGPQVSNKSQRSSWWFEIMLAFFIIPNDAAVPLASKQLQSMMLPSPCLTVIVTVFLYTSGHFGQMGQALSYLMIKHSSRGLYIFLCRKWRLKVSQIGSGISFLYGNLPVLSHWTVCLSVDLVLLN